MYLKETNQDVNLYSRQSEFEHKQIKEYIPIQPEVIMDLGCGLGRSSVYLNHIFHLNDINNEVHYILADTSKDASYYNMNLIASFCTLNGLLNFGLFDLEKSDWKGLAKKVDYVMSRMAYGYNLSIGPILQKLLDISNDNVTMIFGIKDVNITEDISAFKQAIIIKEDNQNEFPHQNWLILRGKK